jgi:hypothetical protein
MNSAASFSTDYSEARGKFCAEAARAGGSIERLSHPERGPDNRDLSTDIAWFGSRSAESVLVTISGTHGVEGFCGSGAQIDWMRRGEASRVPAGLGILMIHAVNPYGFAWLRRVTNENVDLNRNWVDFTGPLPQNPGYDELSEALCPPEWTDEAQDASAAVIGAFVAREGFAALQQAVSGGQYRHPAGIFYGGVAPTWSRRTQTAIFDAYLGQAAKVAILDYHTGLGPWGYAEQIVGAPSGDAAFTRAAAWWGAAVVSLADGASTSALVAGDGLDAAPGLLAKAEVTSMALEVGVQPLMEVLLALRADAWLHAHGDPASAQGRAIKAQIRAAFYGDADEWKGMVAGQSLLACKQAIAGLLR